MGERKSIQVLIGLIYLFDECDTLLLPPALEAFFVVEIIELNAFPYFFRYC